MAGMEGAFGPPEQTAYNSDHSSASARPFPRQGQPTSKYDSTTVNPFAAGDGFDETEYAGTYTNFPQARQATLMEDTTLVPASTSNTGNNPSMKTDSIIVTSLQGGQVEVTAGEALTPYSMDFLHKSLVQMCQDHVNTMANGLTKALPDFLINTILDPMTEKHRLAAIAQAHYTVEQQNGSFVALESKLKRAVDDIDWSQVKVRNEILEAIEDSEQYSKADIEASRKDLKATMSAYHELMCNFIDEMAASIKKTVTDLDATKKDSDANVVSRIDALKETVESNDQKKLMADKAANVKKLVIDSQEQAVILKDVAKIVKSGTPSGDRVKGTSNKRLKLDPPTEGDKREVSMNRVEEMLEQLSVDVKSLKNNKARLLWL
jgi:hypothetical protein